MTEINQKYYFLPESFHALRRELTENYPTFWQRAGYLMGYDATRFVELCSEAFDIQFLVFDSANVDGTCKRILDAARNKRGLSSLHTLDEYYPQRLRNTANSNDNEQPKN